MKALITAFALLSFVAASSIPMARAADPQTQGDQSAPHKAQKAHHAKSHGKSHGKKSAGHHKKGKKSASKKKHPSAPSSQG